MKGLLDNCVHYKAKRLFAVHEVSHACDMGWRQLSNGELLAKAAKAFDVLVTTDKKIRYEHNLERLPIPVVELNTQFTRLQDLQTLSPHLEATLSHIRQFRFVSIAVDGVIEKLAERIQGGSGKEEKNQK